MGRSARRIDENFLRVILIAIFLLFYLVPVWWMVSVSLRTPKEMTFLLPTKIIFDNYIRLFFDTQFLSTLVNSIIVAVFTTAISLTIGTLAGYSLARFKFKQAKPLAFELLTIRMLPPIAVIIPFWLLVRNIGLLDTHFALILLYTAFNIPITTWLMRGFLADIPVELGEAAMTEGCTRLKAFIKTELPLAWGGLGVAAIFCFIFSWNEFLFALILTSLNAKTAPVELAGFAAKWAVEWGLMCAGGTIMMIPTVILTIIVQKHLVRGLTFGILKK